MARFVPHLTYANIVSTLCLFLLVGSGTAYATHLVVRSADIVDGEVKSIDVRDDDLTGGGLTGRDLRAGSVGPSEARDLTGADIADQSIGELDLHTDSVGSRALRGLVKVGNWAPVPANGGGG